MRAIGRVLLTLAIIFFLILIGIPHPRSPSYQYLYRPGSTLPSTLGPSKHNAAIYMLVNANKLEEAVQAVKSVEERFNSHLAYPLILFVPQAEYVATKDEPEWRFFSEITGGKAKIETVSQDMWDIPSSLDQQRVWQNVNSTRFSAGYRSMCRFQSGLFFKHPALATYEWIWRLDTDIFFHCDVPYDPIDVLVQSKAKYAFAEVQDDAVWVQPTLAQTVSQFMRAHRKSIPKENNLEFVWRDVPKALDGNAGNDDWTKRIIYNNFEISHRSLWTSSLYTAFIEYLDQAGGFWYERWGDAPVHSYYVSMVLKKEEAVWLNDTGYVHAGNGLNLCSIAKSQKSLNAQMVQPFLRQTDWL